MAFRSGFERTIDAQLKAAGVKHTYETLKLPYSIDHVYNPDFMLPNGIIIEVKGYFRSPAEIAKMRAVKYAHPERDIRFIFANADKKVLNYKTTHGEWATRHGFPWAEGRVPPEWLK